MVDQTKKLGINAAQSLEKRNNNHSNERQDLINCHFKSVGVCVCAYSGKVMKGFGSGSYFVVVCVCESERKMEIEKVEKDKEE